METPTPKEDNNGRDIKWWQIPDEEIYLILSAPKLPEGLTDIIKICN